MWSCIHFAEDSSVSVVCRTDKDLTLLDEWNVEEPVEMIWWKPKKKTWRGTIIRIHGESTTYI